MLEYNGGKLPATSWMVGAPVTDLRREPVRAPFSPIEDPLQETQLLFGERVEVIENLGEWVRVGAVEQPRYSETLGWVPYPGWVEAKHLMPTSVATRASHVVTSPWAPVHQYPALDSQSVFSLPLGAAIEGCPVKEGWLEISLPGCAKGYVLSKSVSSQALMMAADFKEKKTRALTLGKQLVGMPYHWGGLTPYNPKLAPQNTSIDCSGLIHLVWRCLGQVYPRNACDQHRLCKAVDRDLEPGDLVFRSKDPYPDKIIHVMIVQDSAHLLESSSQMGGVVSSSIEHRLGYPIETVRHTSFGIDYYHFFASPYLHEVT